MPASRARRIGAWTLGSLAALVAAYAILRATLYDIIRFPTPARDMWPALGPGAIVVVNRRAEPRRGDLVVLEPKQGRYVLTRVVALPGDHMAFIDSRPYVDGVKVEWHEVGRSRIDGRENIVWRETLGDRSYLVLDDVNRRMQSLFSRALTGYWVLEDNREYVLGKDSRVFGEVPRAQIRGVVSWALTSGEVPYVNPSGPPDAGVVDAGPAPDAAEESLIDEPAPPDAGT
jgi:signal peptidase I